MLLRCLKEEQKEPNPAEIMQFLPYLNDVFSVVEESTTRMLDLSTLMDGMKCAEDSNDLAYVATTNQTGIG